jgi:hypothetical protein
VKKTARAWLANSRVGVIFPAASRSSVIVIVLFYNIKIVENIFLCLHWVGARVSTHFSFSQTCTPVYITRCKHGKCFLFLNYHMTDFKRKTTDYFTFLLEIFLLVRNYFVMCFSRDLTMLVTKHLSNRRPCLQLRKSTFISMFRN